MVLRVREGADDAFSHKQSRREGRERRPKKDDDGALIGCLCPPAGTLGYNESSFHKEMSQIGFSTHTMDVGPAYCLSSVLKYSMFLLCISSESCSVLQDGILFGMVGAYDWDGGVLKRGINGSITPSREAFESEFPLELKNHAAYLGSSSLQT